MSDRYTFETYLFVSKNKFLITVISENKKKLYEEEYLINQELIKLNFDKLDKFLNENIFKIEKAFKDFVKNIYIILDIEDFLSIELSIKKHHHRNIIDFKSFDYLIKEAKNYCKKTVEDRKILHTVIQNYKINNKDYFFLPKDIVAENFSLDIKFITIPNILVYNLEKILKRYQISLKQVVDASYVIEFFGKNDGDICLMSQKIIEGCNPNEVIILSKTRKNEGFFEKFFKFFN